MNLFQDTQLLTKMRQKSIFILIFVQFLAILSVAAQLHKNLYYYETLHIDDFAHKVVKRGIKHSSNPFNTIKEIEFKALGRNFRLILNPHKEVLHPNFRAYVVNSTGDEKFIHFDHNHLYRGRVFGELDSHVNAHIDDGVITASIILPEETYHIEPSWRHLPHLKDRHMIAYKASDVKFSWDNNDKETPAPIKCGFIKEGLELEADDDDVNEEENGLEEGSGDHFHNDSKFRWASNDDQLNDNNIELPEAEALLDKPKKRTKRQSDQYEYTPTKTRCPLLLVADYRFFQEMGGSNTKTTINYLISLIDRVHKIYNDTIWQDRSDQEGFKGMGFVIKKIVVHSEPTRVRGGEAHYNMVREKWDVRNLLEDPDIPECSPSASQGGSFLMYTYSVSGYDVNNKKFSPCSLRSIRKVLQAKSGRCFSEPEESFCGNLRVEGDEQCDAGLLGTEDNDACCDKNCKLRRNQGAVCSDKNSPCCQNCQFMPAGVKCRDAQYITCEQEARCTGNHADCPKSPPMTDGTICQERGQCRNGKCIPYCETQGLQSCMCDVLQDACKRCCRMSINETCFAVEPLDILPDGTPCIQGFCNKGMCEKTIQDVVERFWDIIEEININKVLKFLRDNLVMVVVFVTTLFWVPASCIISYFDRKNRKEEQREYEWSQKSDLIHPNDRRRVIHIRVPRQKITVARM
uniref:CSON015415 protein n=1 Tax=Culicoides sonorensis TaxID=179676 RepID=A0A336LS44_CULSO